MAMASFPPRPVLSLMRSIAPYTIFSAADFLPRSITMLMNFASMWFPNFGSGRMVRWGAAALRDMETYRSEKIRDDYFLGRLAPYLERPCRRSFTPAQSRAPRTV